MVRVRNGNALSADDCAVQGDRLAAFRQFQAARSRFLCRSASGARQNGIEVFPFFAAAVLLAQFHSAPQRLIDDLAVLFLVVRIAYVFTYLGDRPTLRSILWTVGLAINVAIFFMPLISGSLPI